MASKGNFIKLDELILSSPKIQKLIISLGYEALGFYLALLTTMRSYHATGYKIPLDDLGILTSWQLKLRPDEEERFSAFIDKAVELDILKMSDKYLWSERRTNDLLAQEVAREKMSEKGKEGILKRWEKQKALREG